MTRREDLLSGPVAPTLARLTGPMILGMVGMVGFNMVDTYFIGKLGTEALAAISFTFPVVFIITSIALGLGMGAGSAISRAIGAGDHHLVRRLTTDGLMLAFSMVLTVAMIGLTIIKPLFSALGASAELIPLIHEYMWIWYMGVPFVVIPMVGNGAIRATGDTKTPAAIMLLAVVANVILDPLLIFGAGPIPAMGLRGAALATLVSRAITFAGALYILGGREKMISLRQPSLQEIRYSWGTILFVGLPATLTFLIMPASMAIVTRIVASFGVAAVAGFGVATRIEMLPIMFINALGSVLVPFVGQNLGAGKLARVRSAISVSHLFSLAAGAVAVAIFWCCGRGIAALFDENPDVIQVVVLYGNLVGIGWGLQGVVALSSSAFNALNKPIHSSLLSLLRMVVLYVPLAWLLSQRMGLQGVFVAALIASLIAGPMAAWWLRVAVRNLRQEQKAKLEYGSVMLD